VQERLRLHHLKACFIWQNVCPMRQEDVSPSWWWMRTVPPHCRGIFTATSVTAS